MEITHNGWRYVDKCLCVEDMSNDIKHNIWPNIVYTLIPTINITVITLITKAFSTSTASHSICTDFALLAALPWIEQQGHGLNKPASIKINRFSFAHIFPFPTPGGLSRLKQQEWKKRRWFIRMKWPKALINIKQVSRKKRGKERRWPSVQDPVGGQAE